jgi:hypothetical protein
MAILTSPSRTLAQPQMVPFKLFITELWQLDDDQDPIVGLIGDFYARVTINGVEHRNDDSGDGACDDESSLGIVVPLQLFKNFRKIPQCSKRTPWDFSQLVPAGEPVHVRIKIFDADLALDDELDLKLADGNAISFDVDPATGKWSGDVNYPQNCSRPGLNLGGDNANVCWQASFDTDDDGLLDVWERSGVDTDNDSLIDLDLPALGVNPLRKDIFVEADYLSASNHSHGPSKDAIQRVVASFANAPIANPDNTTGVQLHVDVGSLYGAGAVFQVVGTGGVAGSYGDFGGGNAIEEAGNEIIRSFGRGQGPATQFEDLETDNFNPNRELFFRYAIFGHQTNTRAAANDCTTGAVDLVQRDVLVTLGGVDVAGLPCFQTEAGVSVGSASEQAGTFMHNLGHLLALVDHGGSDFINRKPNYLSVMNFNFQMCSVPASPGLLPGGCDYSRAVDGALPIPLDERSLDECIGIGGGLGFGAVDWNENNILEGQSGCGPIAANSRADVNSDGGCVLAGANNVINTIPLGDDRIFLGTVLDGRDRICSTAAAPGSDDQQVTIVGGTPVQPDVLNSFNDWDNVILDLMAASTNPGGRNPGFEADAILLDDTRRDLGSMMAPAIAVVQTGPATGRPGERVTYSVSVTNVGRGPAISPVLKEKDPDGVVTSSDLGVLTVGSELVQVRSFAIPADACPGDFAGAAATLLFKDFPGRDLSTDTATPLKILDIASPTVDLSVSPSILLPPNHKFVEVIATLTVTDNCEKSPSVTLVSITSNEPESGFLGNGDNGPDIQGAEFGTDDRVFSLRSERGTGQGSAGRIYTITYRVTDGSGNATVRSATVTVPTSNS